MTYGDKTYRVVIAIDFGTSRSGFAYSFWNEKEIKGHLDWPSQLTGGYPKTLTQLLYTPNREVRAWGHPARRELAQLRLNREAKKHFFFLNFKMALKNPSNI